MVHGSYPKFGTRCRQELNASCGQEGCSKLWITSGAQDRQQCSSLGPWGLGPMGIFIIFWWMNNDDSMMNITFLVV
jgi:hypothetical protein